MVTIAWGSGRHGGTVDVTNAELEAVSIEDGDGTVNGAEFELSGDGGRLRVDVTAADTDRHTGRVVVSVTGTDRPFSFFHADVDAAQPIWLPDHGAVVTESEDDRSFRDIVDAARESGGRRRLQAIDDEPEETYRRAADATRDMTCPTWLGLGRDIRIFTVGFRDNEHAWDWIQPRLHGRGVAPPETGAEPIAGYPDGETGGFEESDDPALRYQFMVGRGQGPVLDVSRRLEQGTLPILRGSITDGDVEYETTSFVSLEDRPLTADAVEGTNYLVADSYGLGFMQTDAQAAKRAELLPGEMDNDEETVLYVRVRATNTGSVPRYAYFKNVAPNREYRFDGAAGATRDPDADRVYSVSTLNGDPLAREETALLLEPGEEATLEFYVPHQPIPADRAVALRGTDFDARLAACRDYWTRKLEAAADLDLPETRIEEMTAAGLLHLDLVAYGSEPDGTLVPAIGRYTAIGSESAPIVQFLDSMGRHDLARRALTYFLDKQHEDGMIQNFGGYMLETGAALWSIGEHYRYTRDEEWVERIEEHVLDACDYLIEWRERDRDGSGAPGDGLMRGKTADPEDPYRSFMLNGYNYLGLSRGAELLAAIDSSRAPEVRDVADDLGDDIRAALADAMGRSPVVPLGDGSWCPTAPPWPEHRGPLSLYADGQNWYTHGAFQVRDSLLGPLWLVAQEVIGPEERPADYLLHSHAELMTERNVAFSQPYYSPHPWVHLQRGETKRFLKAYYNALASLADPETYSFWEHYFRASSHKTHEEGWFLMQTRRMLYMEDGDTLSLFRGIPRSWLADGETLSLEGVATYFGHVSVRAEAELGVESRIAATVEFHACEDRRPETLAVRLPHPSGDRPVDVAGGEYDASRETVRVDVSGDSERVRLDY